MVYQMKLLEQPFEDIKCGKKVIELRLNDEKRRTINLGDTIEFLKQPYLDEKIQAKVIGLVRYDTFDELFKDIPLSLFGCGDLSVDQMKKLVYSIYTKEEEQKYGVLGIRIELT